MGLAEPVQGTAKLFSGEATGLLVQLPGWKYPAVVDTLSGSVRFDVYAGAWGDRGQLDRFLPMYAVERAKREARHKGFPCTEQQLADGSIKLIINEGN